MKTIVKTSYLILGSVFLLSSCAQEDTLAVRTDGVDRRIVFHTSLPGLTTKATEIVTDLPNFYMTAFDETDGNLIKDGKLVEYFDKVFIDKEKNSGKWLTDKCVWPEPGKESDLLHFFAYYPELKKLGGSLVNGTSVNGSDKTIGYKIDGFKVASDIAEQVDFVTAYTTGSMADNLFSGIQLNFEHQLSRIEIKAWGANKSCDIEIAGVRIGGVNINGIFDFNPSKDTSEWSHQNKGIVEHIFGKDEQLVILSKKNNSHTTLEAATSIMGGNLDDKNNFAMLIPTADETGWKYSTDINNGDQGMFISVLLRVIDKTPTAGEGGKPTQQYPYFDNSQGLNAMNIPREYFAVVKSSGKVSKRLYKKNDSYFSDAACTQSYTLSSGEEVKEFGWASLPITGNWEAGYSYTYTLDYTSGVGLHDPSVGGTISPRAGDPIISDIVGVSVSVNDWQGDNKGNENTINDVVVPGS